MNRQEIDQAKMFKATLMVVATMVAATVPVLLVFPLARPSADSAAEGLPGGYQRLSPQEADAYAARLLELLRAGEPDPYDAVVDWQVFRRRLGERVRDLPLDPVDRWANSLRRRGLAPLFGMLPGWDWELRGLGERDGLQTVRFGALSPAGRASFVELLVVNRHRGMPAVVDAWSLFDGGLASRRAEEALRMDVVVQPSLGARALGHENAWIAHARDLSSASAELRAGQGESALSTLDGLPSDLRSSPTVRRMRMEAARLTGDPRRYRQILAGMLEVDPQDAGALMALALSLEDEGEWDVALPLLRRLNALYPDSYFERLIADASQARHAESTPSSADAGATP